MIQGSLLIIALYLVAWLGIYLVCRLLKSDRYGLSATPAYFMFRTTFFNRIIESIAKRRRQVWKSIWNAGVVISIGLMALMAYQLVTNLFHLIYRTKQAAPIQLIVPLPGLAVSWGTFPYLILAISVVVVTHEVSHGIASIVDRIPLKSAGVFLAVVLPGGFVEPHEEKLEQSSTPSRLRVFSAGSFTNVLLGVLFLFLLANFTATVSPFYSIDKTGVLVGGLLQGYPAQKAGLQTGEVLESINGTRVLDIRALMNYMSGIKPGSTLHVSTSARNLYITTGPSPANPNQAIMGITDLSDDVAYIPKLWIFPSQLPLYLPKSEFWLSLVLISVALVNMLPIYPFDGDKVLDSLLKMLRVKRIKEVRTAASAICLALLLMNFFFSWLRFGFIKF